jgi:CRP-like cAMP-binding protein
MIGFAGRGVSVRSVEIYEEASMNHLLLLGPKERAAVLAGLLQGDDCCITLISDENRLAQLGGHGPYSLLVAEVEDESRLPDLSAAIRRLSIPWLACSGSPAPTLAAAAYRAGALAVLPFNVPPDLVERTVRSVLSSLRPEATPALLPSSISERRRHRYQQGEQITLADDAVLEVKEGVVALTALHADGAEVLLGLFGPGQLLPGHPTDGCAIEYTAHTGTEVRTHSWSEALGQPELAEKLRLRLRQMEAWASMQARPYMEQRVLGILGLLAEPFGRPHPRGLLVDVRLTHVQLASAVGGTRATVTRLISQLRRRGLLGVIRSAEGMRFCLPQQASSVLGRVA